jgi:hypothetical protein
MSFDAFLTAIEGGAMNVTKRDRHVVYHEYAVTLVDGRATAKDLGDAVAWARRDLIPHEERRIYDDEILARSTDEEIIVYWKEEQ